MTPREKFSAQEMEVLAKVDSEVGVGTIFRFTGTSRHQKKMPAKPAFPWLQPFRSLLHQVQ
jgi:hypothetical protein